MSICDRCIHDEVCGLEGNHEEAIAFCSEIMPKTGHWITTRTLKHDGEYYCDKCLSDAPYNCRTSYCPNCGCKMESEDKGC